MRRFIVINVIIVLTVTAFKGFTQTFVTDRIKLNQVGFYPEANKLAIVTGKVDSKLFYVTTTNLTDTLYTGTLSEERTSAYSNTITRVAEFSGLQQVGNYVIVIPGIGHSYVFTINDGVLKGVAISVLKGFYFQRASMPLKEEFAGRWRRSAGHPDNVVYVHASAATEEKPEGTIISSPGGWYDAGDYNKYIVNSGITMGTMLSAYEDFPAYFDTLNTNIPESNNRIPDILDENLYNLRWMFTMQDSKDGGVYHKCTNAAFDAMVMPGVTKEKRYVVQKSTGAALDFAAVMAQSARVYKAYSKQLPGIVDSCLKAAIRAYEWAGNNPNAEYSQNTINKIHKPEITTGECGDRMFKDEWLWAGSELFITTKDQKYLIQVKENMSDSAPIPGWPSVEMLGWYSLLRHQTFFTPEVKALVKPLQVKLLSLCDRMISNVRSNAFQTIMSQSKNDFNWGSNSVAANQSIALINAYRVSRKTKYLDFALTNADYLLGRNATGYCFVTGTGSKSTMHPHHRPSVSDGVTEPVPGLLAGGPNPAQQDKCKYQFTGFETSYADIDCSYASNEIAINWNAPAVYLFNALEAYQFKIGKNN